MKAFRLRGGGAFLRLAPALALFVLAYVSGSPSQAAFDLGLRGNFTVLEVGATQASQNNFSDLGNIGIASDGKLTLTGPRISNGNTVLHLTGLVIDSGRLTRGGEANDSTT
jgi:hypothetical protein